METRIEIHFTAAEMERAVISYVHDLHSVALAAQIKEAIGADHEFRLYPPRDSKGPWRAAWIPPQTKGTSRGGKRPADAGGNGENVED